MSEQNENKLPGDVERRRPATNEPTSYQEPAGEMPPAGPGGL